MNQFLRFVLAALVMAGSMVSSVSAGESESLTLYGVRRYNISGGYNGLYSIEVKSGAQPQLEWSDGDMIGNGGAVYADGTLYVLTWLSFWGDVFWGYQICDVEKHTYTYDYPEGLQTRNDVAACLTYDPSTDIIYAVCLGDETGLNFDLCTMDRSNGKKDHLFRLPRRIFTLASTAAGDIYGVADDGVLYQINKYNGELTTIGSTGLIPSADQSAVIDYETNVMYWSAVTENGNGLYTTDITTGETTLVSFYEDGWQFTGLFLKQVAKSSSAPLGVENLTPAFEGASLTGNLEFVLPTKDSSDNELTSVVEYSVMLDGEVLAAGSGNPGSEVIAEVTVPVAGSCRFVVTTSCDGVSGMAANIELWVGMDTPQAVTDITLSVDGDVVTTTWELPERGVHGGFVDHSKVRYMIDRGPEDECITDNYEGTSFSETLHFDGVYIVMYRITPYIGDLVGEEVISDWVRVGDHFVPPCTIDFSDPFNSLIVDVIDANNDRATWHYDLDHNAMACEWPISNDFKRDDWMITVPVSLTGDNTYEIGAEVASEGKWDYEGQTYVDTYAGEFAIYIGHEPYVGAMTSQIVGYEIVESMDYQHRKAPYLAPETGLYYIGLHLRGGIDRGNVYNALVRSISVSAGTTAIESADKDVQFSAVSVDSGIVVFNPATETVRVVSLDGRVVATTSASSEELTLNKGIYIVTAGSKSVKVAVK